MATFKGKNYDMSNIPGHVLAEIGKTVLTDPVYSGLYPELKEVVIPTPWGEIAIPQDLWNQLTSTYNTGNINLTASSMSQMYQNQLESTLYGQSMIKIPLSYTPSVTVKPVVDNTPLKWLNDRVGQICERGKL